MPIYEYLCQGCGRRFEQLQKFSDEPLAADPDCGGTVRRVIQPVGVIFKGSGFYVTDSRSSSSASSAPSSPDTSSDSAKKTEPKTESKTETKTDSKATAPAA